MCGITGIVSLAPIKTSLIQAMTDSVRHRGPDGEGFLTVGEIVTDQALAGVNHIETRQLPNLAFGHRRLAIQDLSTAGDQPMSYLDRFHITYNGEVYNFPELRGELERDGYAFSSQTDTEVILAAYAKWGAACLERLNGMWAFAIFDQQERKLFLARDRFGIKPLYYFATGRTFAFASEIKALLSHPEMVTAPNRKYCLDYIKGGAREFQAATAFTNVFRFPNASYSEVELDRLVTGDLSVTNYWELRPVDSDERFDEGRAKAYAHKYYELLRDAVRIRLRADVKVGTALSGGLDSSSVVYLVNQELKSLNLTAQQKTFSSVYKSPGVQYCDESRFIDELAAHLQVETNQIEPRVPEIIEEHRKLIYMTDTPPDNTCMSGWYTFKCVGASDVTVTLDGQGADEQLSGYHSYLMPYLAGLPLGRLLREAIQFRKTPGASVWVLRGVALNFLRRCVSTKHARRLARLAGVPGDPFRALNQILAEDTLGNLLTLIHYSDRGSMAHSVESRMPFMDYRLAEFLAELPAAYKVHGGWTKYIARLAFDGRLPDSVCWRRDKMGWPIPENEWFRGPLKEWFCSTIENSGFLAELGVGRDARKRIESGERVNKLVRLLNLAVWHETFFGKAAGVRFAPRAGDAKYVPLPRSGEANASILAH